VVCGGPALLQLRWADPKTVSGLATFSCGGSSPHEVEVDELVHELHAHGPMNVRVAEDAVGDVAGICMFHPRALGPFTDAANFRGARVGDRLLSDALTIISVSVNGPMPFAWAMIAPANEASHRLFERHGFLDVAPAQTSINQSHYDWRFRAPGLPV
jgi:hypothetical protein